MAYMAYIQHKANDPVAWGGPWHLRAEEARQQMSTLTLEAAPVSTEVETPIQTPHQSAALTLEDKMVRQQAHEATRTRFQQVVFASRFARIARQVRNGALTPQDTLDAVQQLVASVA
jgi:hypothetical protein